MNEDSRQYAAPSVQHPHDVLSCIHGYKIQSSSESVACYAAAVSNYSLFGSDLAGSAAAHACRFLGLCWTEPHRRWRTFRALLECLRRCNVVVCSDVRTHRVFRCPPRNRSQTRPRRSTAPWRGLQSPSRHRSRIWWTDRDGVVDIRRAYSRRVHVSGSLLTWSAAVIRSLMTTPSVVSCSTLSIPGNAAGSCIDLRHLPFARKKFPLTSRDLSSNCCHMPSLGCAQACPHT